MKLFLDTSVLLAASESPLGASREIFQRARSNDWTLITTRFVLREVSRNMHTLSPQAAFDWNVLRLQIVFVEDSFVLNRADAYTKDNPILLSALASADALLTVDEGRFGSLMQTSFHELVILRPGIFLQQQRASGRLN
ncbi:MAG: hypothetical protein JWO95_201 [Verrucomicrobiales bacterium]|nr:hypothetical protein [Verrucomicrobiales bacterium]